MLGVVISFTGLAVQLGKLLGSPDGGGHFFFYAQKLVQHLSQFYSQFD